MKKAVEELIQFVSIPNNVYAPDQIRENALFLKEIMEKRGIKAEIIETPTNRPLVYGELFSAEAERTILIYSHYDGVPVEKSEWHSDPFRPVIRKDVINGTSRIYGRSSADSKNAIIAALNALDILKENGIDLHVNLKFLFDGEEEVESPSLKNCLEQNKDKFAADLVISASGETHQSGLPTIELGFRGILQFELQVYTGLADLHSGHFGNFFPNAAFGLASLISSMKDVNGRAGINGFYEEIVPLTNMEMDLIKKVPNIEEELKSNFGIAMQEIEGHSLQELINLPTLNVRGMSAGYVGENARNIIPHSATAEFDVRLVKGMDVDHTFQMVKDHIQSHGWKVLEKTPSLQELCLYSKIAVLRKTAGFPATKTSIDSEAAEYVISSLKRVFGEGIVILPTEGGSLPLYIFEQQKIPVIGLPTSNFDCNQHTHDENLRMDFFKRAIDTFISLFSA